MKLIDLSYSIENGMPTHPYDNEPTLFQDRFLEKDEYNNYCFQTGTHTGTHVDSPMHLTKSTSYISEYDLENFCGEACVLDVSEEEIIKYKDSYKEKLKNNSIVLLYTGHEKKYGQKEYYTTHPVIDFSMAEFLVESNVKLIGMDTPSPDKHPFLIHKYLFSKKMCLLENLCNLGLLLNENRIELFAFPLKIKADASLVRAVARIAY
ncbi:MAG: cyclase [Firmicutes bacterium HGW-Firmicutes-12]|jgi:kynurenine formamidase|nr:MAG: cyclase [Firmicutes bacterium HGW-Firmicutes-12]